MVEGLERLNGLYVAPPDCPASLCFLRLSSRYQALKLSIEESVFRQGVHQIENTKE